MDSDFIYSFRSSHFAIRLHKNSGTISNALMVAALVKNSLIANYIFENYIIIIKSHDFVVNLILLEF